MRGEEALPGALRDAVARSRPGDPARLRAGRELADDDLQEGRARLATTPPSRRARREIADRFGEPPPAVGRLIAYARLRAAAERLGVTSLTRQAGRVHVRFAEDAPRRPRAPPRVRPGTPGREPLAGPGPHAPGPGGGRPAAGLERPPPALSERPFLGRFPEFRPDACVMNGRMKARPSSCSWRPSARALGLAGGRARRADRRPRQRPSHHAIGIRQARLAWPSKAARATRPTWPSCAAQILEDMIREKLLDERAKEMSVAATDEEVEAAVAARQGAVQPRDRRRVRRRARDSGMNRDDLKRQMRETITLQKVIGRDVTSKLDLSDDALRIEYERRKDQFYAVPASAHVAEIVIRFRASTGIPRRRRWPRRRSRRSAARSKAGRHSPTSRRSPRRATPATRAGTSGRSPRASSSRPSTWPSSSTPPRNIRRRLCCPTPSTSSTSPSARRPASSRSPRSRTTCASGSPTSSTRSASPSTWTSCGARPSSRSTIRAREARREGQARRKEGLLGWRLRLPLPRLFLRRGRALARLVRPAALSLRRRRLRSRPVGCGPASWTFRARARALEVAGSGVSRAQLARLARRVFSLDVDLSAFGGALAERARAPRALERGAAGCCARPALRGRRQDASDDQLLLGGDARHGHSARRRWRGDGAFPGPEAVARMCPGDARAAAYAAAIGPPRFRGLPAASLRGGWIFRPGSAARLPPTRSARRSSPSTASDRTRRRASCAILGRHEYLALDSWVRKQYRRSYRGPAKTVDRAIARRYARFGDFKGLALWLDMTRDWHEGV